MLDDALAHRKGKVEAAKLEMAILEVLHDAQGVEIMVEAKAVSLERLVEGPLAGMAEGGMADVVGEGEGFGEVFIEAKGTGDGARDLRDFHGVSEAAAEMIGAAMGEDLGFACETAKGAGVDDAAAIALKRGTVGMIGLRVCAVREGSVLGNCARGRHSRCCHEDSVVRFDTGQVLTETLGRRLICPSGGSMEPDMTQQRQEAHLLLDAVPDSKISAVRSLLETIADPLSRALANAQLDEEPISEELAQELAEGRASLARGEGIPHEEILKEFGLTWEDWDRMGQTPVDATPPSTSR